MTAGRHDDSAHVRGIESITGRKPDVLDAAEPAGYNIRRFKRGPPVPIDMGVTVCGCGFWFLGSSMVEHAAVNRRVVGSSPTRGANPFSAEFDIPSG